MWVAVGIIDKPADRSLPCNRAARSAALERGSRMSPHGLPALISPGQSGRRYRTAGCCFSLGASGTPLLTCRELTLGAERTELNVGGTRSSIAGDADLAHLSRSGARRLRCASAGRAGCQKWRWLRQLI